MEKRLQTRLINELLLRGHYVWRNNSGVSKASYTDRFGRVSNRMWRAGITGGSDIIGIHKSTGQFIAVECKIKPNKPTPAQTAFLQNIETRGGIAIVAYTIEDVTEHEQI